VKSGTEEIIVAAADFRMGEESQFEQLLAKA
jgi:hypothetical protein